MSLQAIIYNEDKLLVLDQLLLPYERKYISVSNVEDAFAVIKKMQVRGAPAIAIVAALSVAVGLKHLSEDADAKEYVINSFEHLKQSRPTAVNLFETAKFMQGIALQEGKNCRNKIIQEAERMLVKDLEDNHNIGTAGRKFLLQHYKDKDKLTVLTHCNTGSLATSGYGTALGIIRSLHESGNLEHAYCTETRPYNQGSRLTAFELVHDKIPATLVTDSTVASIMHKIDAIVVGADRVTRNGDTANKIGTYNLAILAKHFGKPFIVAAPFSSIDTSLASGSQITIEQRPPIEMTTITGPIITDSNSRNLEDPKRVRISIAAPGIDVYSPAFDVTPANLITAIATEKGFYTQQTNNKYDFS
ncbi:methylthioribose-1-phosphate isomerase Mri1 [Schizosaccharomyces pombe]|uniref:Methylthioribose-1-phosphate isomerase n=1 Tax=Schizosaccharomyces pombe (strain 972 / ATCC 24843) TaxID=284812 RepID=MTNA_SCHPO|nr:putative methylthioribose-1-phosphate isomerase [Schizosaccharomyces pombe]O60185.1 RecName: Full=Methylthioribose-1-phosphate isomerase; Short=M1Pi; Short=MTR-1-P isomerase; AltName: Full=S-methyl-5-thioribose-1-phosphate isomerase; AltName: Full=Translation initiation factor eIF-2B subunit alpha/beta/delta-like protein [Schizosaccharomyces pombe 972h-]CAA18878.1 methylthioribose-1-phosphate isomerase (predicted) [Schizosaccharomyces pombe]|eukprot:NP_596610.1 putative methylthioribose-1-phosphate isomerase [Schizosaccharomyces pombe]